MDLYCVKCGEPWDHDELHEMGSWIGETLTYGQARDRFYAIGCKAFGSSCNDAPDTARADAMGAMVELLGDDTDGVAAMMEDLDYLGMLG